MIECSIGVQRGEFLFLGGAAGGSCRGACVRYGVRGRALGTAGGVRFDAGQAIQRQHKGNILFAFGCLGLRDLSSEAPH